MGKRWMIALWVLLVLLALAALALTVLNKSWWARRINSRWNVTEMSPPASDAPPGFDKPTFTKVKFDAAKAASYSLGELMRMFFQGQPHWNRYE